MAFVTDGIGNVGRYEFPGIAVVMAGRIGFFDDCRYLIVFGLIASLLSFLFGNGLRNSRQRRFLLEVEVFVIFRMEEAMNAMEPFSVILDKVLKGE